jgi:CDGSH-type Zn-finger protein
MVARPESSGKVFVGEGLASIPIRSHLISEQGSKHYLLATLDLYSNTAVSSVADISPNVVDTCGCGESCELPFCSPTALRRLVADVQSTSICIRQLVADVHAREYPLDAVC